MIIHTLNERQTETLKNLLVSLQYFHYYEQKATEERSLFIQSSLKWYRDSVTIQKNRLLDSGLSELTINLYMAFVESL